MRNRLRAIAAGIATANVCFVAALATPAYADVITDWNQTAIAAMKAANTGGNPSTRNMAMMHVAMSDAVNSVQNKFAIYAPGGTQCRRLPPRPRLRLQPEQSSFSNFPAKGR